MLDESVTDFRSVIEEKIKLKKSALDQTEQHLKKFSILRENNGTQFPNDSAISRQNSERNQNFQNRGSVRGRLGPPPNSRLSLESRLGPKVQDYEPFDDDEGGKSILSRVVVGPEKSRDEAVAEETKKMDKKEKTRNRRMFGNLLGTLQKFKQDEKRVTDREQKKREIEKKIEEKTEKEKEEAKRTKYELFSEKKKQQQEIKMLQIQMERVQQYELWEKNKRREMQYIKTTTATEGHPQIFYLPKEHNDKTLAKYDASIKSIEEEIKTAKASFEEDLLKIESKMSQNPERLMRDEDLIHEEDDIDDNDETENKPRSVITVAKAPKRPREESHRKEPEKSDPKDLEHSSRSKTEPIDKTMRITIKNETKPTEANNSTAPPSLPPPATVPPLAKKIKVEKGLAGSQEKKPSSEKSRKRKDSSSGSADSSDSSSDSDSSSEDENSPKKMVKRIKIEKK